MYRSPHPVHTRLLPAIAKDGTPIPLRLCGHNGWTGVPGEGEGGPCHGQKGSTSSKWWYFRSIWSANSLHLYHHPGGKKSMGWRSGKGKNLRAGISVRRRNVSVDARSVDVHIQIHPSSAGPSRHPIACANEAPRGRRKTGASCCRQGLDWSRHAMPMPRSLNIA